MWQHVFPIVGFEHPFVLHAILSLAALHIARGHGTKASASTVKAAEHHNKAIQGFQQSVTNITPTNSEALVVCSILNLLYVFGIRAYDDEGAKDGPRRSFKEDLILGVEWIPMIRGIKAVLGPTHNYLLNSHMQGILSVGNWYELKLSTPGSDGFDEFLCRMAQIWNNDNSQREVYDDALETLRRSHHYIRQFEIMDAATLAAWGSNRQWAGPLMFIHFAPQAFFTLLHQRQPPALVLFAHFGALLHKLDSYWFMEGWGRKIIEVVSGLLGTYWRTWIDFPLEMITSAS